MQSLYEWDFHQDQSVAEIADRVMEPVKKDVDIEYVHRVVEGTIEHVKDIDTLIANAAPEWPLDQIAAIDRNILRMALWEFAVHYDTAMKVAINEAVEPAKQYGSDSAPRFVNGVQGARADHQHEIQQALRNSSA